MRRILFLIFALSAIVSHYSTNFILLALVAFVYVLTHIISQPLVKNTIALATRRIFFLIFALGVIVSHDIISFILLAVVALIYFLTFIISRPLVKNFVSSLISRTHITLKNRFPHKAFLSLPLILLLFFMTYVWNTLYTNTADHAGSVIAEVVNSILVKSNDAAATELSYSLFFAPQPEPKREIQNYTQSIRQSAGSTTSGKGNISPFYSKSITDKYPSYPVEQEQLAPTPLGNLLSSFHIPVFNIQAGLKSLSAYLMQILVFTGLLALFFMKQKKPFDLQYLLLCVGAIFLLALITVLPALSIEYGVLRMFQQFLFILSLPIVLGISSLLFFVKEQRRILFTGIIAIVFFLNLTGFFSHLTGDYYPQMYLDNAGLYYDSYYVHKADIFAITWLAKNNVNNEPVEAGLTGINKMLTYGNIIALNEILPEVIRENAYVYLDASSNTIVAIDQNLIIINSPKSFLDDNKSLIYSNGKDNIYK